VHVTRKQDSKVGNRNFEEHFARVEPPDRTLKHLKYCSFEGSQPQIREDQIPLNRKQNTERRGNFIDRKHR
jgi:hypothetical protein